jgi:hypothetical protein
VCAVLEFDERGPWRQLVVPARGFRSRLAESTGSESTGAAISRRRAVRS